MSVTVDLNTTFRLADSREDLRQIRDLTYRTFVDEVVQVTPERFNELWAEYERKNIFLIGVRANQVIASVGVREERPFSLERLLTELDVYLMRHLPRPGKLCEIGALCLERSYRGGLVFAGLCIHLASHCLDKQYDYAIAFGLVSRPSLYRLLGFVPFGPVVGSAEVPLQPMLLALHDVRGRLDRYAKRLML